MFGKALIFGCLLGVGFGFCPMEVLQGMKGEKHVQDFVDFILNFNRTYQDKTELIQRLKNFQINMIELLGLQKEQPNMFGINDLMDWSMEEKSHLTGNLENPNFGNISSIPTIPTSSSSARGKRQAPTNFDWRDTGKVSPVKQQGRCGSCWAHVTAAITESAYLIRDGTLLDLSEQEMVDCEHFHGCQGGWDDFTYVREYGLAEESAYPYTGVQAKCKELTTGKRYICDWSYVGNDDSGTKMMDALRTHGPLYYSFYAPQEMSYFNPTTGVYEPTDAKCNEARQMGRGHAVTIVGYGVEEGTGKPYWTAKNSWGTGWGNGGYFRLYRGTNRCSMGQGWAAASAKGKFMACNDAPTPWGEDNCKSYSNLAGCDDPTVKANCKGTCGLCDGSTVASPPGKYDFCTPCQQCAPMTINNPGQAGTSITPAQAAYDCGAQVQYKCDKTAGNDKVCFKVETIDANGTPGGFTECFPTSTWQAFTCNRGKWTNQTQTIVSLTCTQEAPSTVAPTTTKATTPAPTQAPTTTKAPAPTPAPTTAPSTNTQTPTFPTRNLPDCTNPDTTCRKCSAMTITNPNNAGTTINPQLASYDCGANVQYYCNKTAGNTQVCFKVDTVDANGTPGGFTECFPNYSYQTITCNNGKWANGTQTITALTCTQVSEPKPCAPLVMTNVNNAVISANPAQTSYAIGATPMFNCGRPGNVPVGSKKICMVEYWSDGTQSPDQCFANNVWVTPQCQNGQWAGGQMVNGQWVPEGNKIYKSISCGLQ